MAVDFPSSPTLNQSYTDGSRTWTYNGTGWQVVTDGWKIIPQITKTSAYTIQRSDSGSHISITTGGITVPSGVFSIGDCVSVYNNSTSNQTITQGASATLRQAGTTNTGNRTLAAYGFASILCVDTNVFIISGAGIS